MCEQAEAVVSRKSELYVLSTCFSVNGGREYKVFSEKTGIRTFRFDADKGFFPEWENRK